MVFPEPLAVNSSEGWGAFAAHTVTQGWGCRCLWVPPETPEGPAGRGSQPYQMGHEENILFLLLEEEDSINSN